MNKKIIYCVLIMALVLGCAGTGKKTEEVAPEVKAPAAPVIINNEMEEILLLKPEEPENAPERLYSIAIRGSDVKSVLMSFSKESEYNIILDPEVSGTVTIDLKEVTLERALNAILTPLGYVYRKEANIIMVSKPKPETRIFTLNYLATKRTGKTTVEAKTTGGVEGKSESGATVSSEEETDLWKDIENDLKAFLSEDGKLAVNKMASLIMVTDYPANLEKIAEFLKTVEGTVQRQVLIEARIIEVTLSDDYQMGLNWEHILAYDASISFLKETGTVPTYELFKFTFTGDLTGLLHAMSKQGDINIISKPRITTLNNQKAIIKVGTEEVYFEYETTYGTVGSAGGYETKFFTVGLVLDVTPQIGTGDELTLHIHPAITEKVDEREHPDGGTVPIVSIRESSSVVKVKSGETLVLAGLLMEKNTEEITGIPFLMNIPLLGYLFRYEHTTKSKTELVVTLTPTILTDKGMDRFSDDEFIKKALGTER